MIQAKSRRCIFSIIQLVKLKTRGTVGSTLLFSNAVPTLIQDGFIRRYAKANRGLSQFEADIGRYGKGTHLNL